MKLTYCKDLVTPGKIIDLNEVFDLVKSDQLSAKIAEIRSALANDDKDKYETLKKSLPGFTPSGVFRDRRQTENLTSYSGVIHLDIDKIPESKVESVRSILRDDPACAGYFVSPSGNGVKVFVRVGFDQDEHSKLYPKILRFYESKLGVKIDSSCKDIARLCFFSYDPEAYFNPDSSDFDEFQLSVSEKKKSLREVLKEVEQRAEYKDGNRNNFVFHFAVACCHYGIPKAECLGFSLEEFGDIEDEIPSAIDSAYSGKYDYMRKTSIRFHGGKTTAIEAKLIDLDYSFRYDVVRQIVEVSKAGSLFVPMTETVFNDVYRDLDASGHPISTDKLKTVLHSSFSLPYDPFRSYFLQLPEWDGIDRIQQLADTVPVENKNHWVDALARWLIAMLAGAIQDDKINQQVLVLAGAQGIGKTTWLNRLIPPELKAYTINGVLNPKDKDSLAQLSECILINMDELESLNSNQQGYLKELITKPHVRLRRPYARNAERSPRRATFAASVNNLNFLTDTTGNRRFLCFQVTGTIDYKHTIDMEQLWSQVFLLFREGKKYWFDGEEIDRINSLNEQFYQASSEEEFLLEFFQPASPDDLHVERLSATMIIDKICYDLGRTIRMSAVQMGKALTRHGFKAVKEGGLKKYIIKKRKVGR